MHHQTFRRFVRVGPAGLHIRSAQPSMRQSLGYRLGTLRSFRHLLGRDGLGHEPSYDGTHVEAELDAVKAEFKKLTFGDWDVQPFWIGDYL